MPYKIMAPRDGNIDVILRQKILPPFSDEIMGFIDAVSSYILKDITLRRFAELVAMAFWMRRTNILRLRETFEKQKRDKLWLGRGIVFHIAPSNVDTIFIYSWFISMLVGNLNIIRISSKSDEQLDLLIGVINEIIGHAEFSGIKDQFLIVRYEHNDDVTSDFSSHCDVRVIWGGDETIRKIRGIPILPTATELIFADKFSFCLINAGSFLDFEKRDTLIDKFYNDAYWFGQNACSSPRMVVWLGDDSIIDQARSLFWEMLGKKVIKMQTEYAPSVAVDKLVAQCLVAAEASGNINIHKRGTNLMNTLLLESPGDVKRDLHCGGGLFYELKIKDLGELSRIVDKKDQTISVFGFNADELTEIVSEARPEGVNRIVPIGEALSFSAVWDGYDLFREFCREIEITVK